MTSCRLTLGRRSSDRREPLTPDRTDSRPQCVVGLRTRQAWPPCSGLRHLTTFEGISL
jgi:hypothetical protein